MIGPGRRLNNCRKNRIVCLERKLQRKERTLNRIFLIFGLTSNAPNRFQCWWWSRLVRAVGVCPRGDQLRFSGETREKPDSSTKTSQACSSRHFFYPGPDSPVPVGDLLVISPDRQPLYLLRAPVHSIHQTPHPTGRIAHLELLPDHMPDPVQGPVVFAISVSVCASQEFLP